MESILKLARPEIVAMTPYSSARREQMQGNIWLNANENPWNKEDLLNRYPEPQPHELIEKISHLYQAATDSVIVTRGSDEAIDLLMRVFCVAGKDTILITPPTYGMYKVSAVIQNAAVVSVPLIKQENFSLDLENILKIWQPAIKLIFLCSPNNPTGNVLEKEKIVILCQKLMDKALVVVDEAYVEFADTPSISAEIANFPNLIVLRTLSKAFGLAGVRCGTVIANPNVIMLLKQILAPYPVPRPISKIVCDALTENGIKNMQLVVRNMIKEREWLINQLKSLSFVIKIWSSQANFILLKVTDAEKVLSHCLSRGIVLRNRSNDYNLENCIRITVGTPEENRSVIEVLRTC